jgi:hypothetical protein
MKDKFDFTINKRAENCVKGRRNMESIFPDIKMKFAKHPFGAHRVFVYGSCAFLSNLRYGF